MPLANLIIWQIVGHSRLEDGKWINFFYDLSWNVMMASSVILLAILTKTTSNSKVNGQPDEQALVYKWCTYMLVVLKVRIWAELILVCIVGYPLDNIVLFVINVALFGVFVNRWTVFGKSFN